jgi:ABC-2 type transport system ATP-binding protein
MSIQVDHISKLYGAQKALDDVSFSVGSSEVVGFLGPNGAGKSTMMKILTCFLPPSSGRATVCGFDTNNASMDVRRNVGYLPEHNPLYLDLYVREYLAFMAGIHGLRNKDARVREMIDMVGLGREQHKRIGQLSKGYRQRVGLAQAMIHDPKVLILDEPTSGLDPLQILGIRDLIKSLAGHKTIIFSTHILQEVSPVTDRVVIINEGSIIADGTVADLSRGAMGTNRVFVGARAEAGAVEAALRSLPAVTELKPLRAAEGCRFEARGPFSEDLVGSIERLARERGWQLTELHEAPYSLEDTFIALTRRARGLKEVA